MGLIEFVVIAVLFSLLVVGWLVSGRVAARDRRAEEEAAATRMAYLRDAHALSCLRCGELAYPLGGTANRYRCEGCRRQFAGARHPC